ncbi:MAG: hypothetical protein A2Z96_05305 [Spirochaetes bacterium GWB1_48_6]|nr:MAG: hypothetical protein A2Z96_05305 [Spirochaetes bacterium GWB1_48_6]
MRFYPLIAASSFLFLFGCPSVPPKTPVPVEVNPVIVPDAANHDPITTIDTTQPQAFVVSQEVYDRTFQEIEKLITTLNTLIADRRFDQWKDYLDTSAILSMSDAKTLAELSDRPILKKFNIKLKTISDYFTYVVVPSRSNAKLDEILFMDNNHVTAFTVIKGEKSILYQLKRDGSQWKITIW